MCSICCVKYNKTYNYPMTCKECNHVYCRPCITTWINDPANKRSCPDCKTYVTNITENTELMNLVDSMKNPATVRAIPVATGISVDNVTVAVPVGTPVNNKTRVFQTPNYMSNKQNEVIKDKCGYAIYVIDNSGSMEYYTDGKVYEISNGRHYKRNCTRWEEAKHNTLDIANYNIKRKMKASYYLLNPQNLNTWVQNTDYVVIDPNIDSSVQLSILHNLLNDSNIRGNTPLDVVTKYVTDSMASDYSKIPICYCLITDGLPNDARLFEAQLRNLANNYNIFLTIVLCTEDDRTVEYYNNLDKELGNEMSGMDVTDDIESEQREVLNAGNSFFVYSKEIHVCRMAGCFSVLADMIDEKKMAEHWSATLTNQILGNFEACNWSDVDYIDCVKNAVKKREKVYSIYHRKMMPIIDVKKLERIISKNHKKPSFFSRIFGCGK